MNHITTLAQVAHISSGNATTFRHEFHTWLKDMSRGKTRADLIAAITPPPYFIHEASWSSGSIELKVADCFLEAYVEQLCVMLKIPPRKWVHREWSRPRQEYSVREKLGIVLPTGQGRGVRDAILQPFQKRRLIQPGMQLPFQLRRGRPKTRTKQQLRKANAERQRRFRARRKALRLEANPAG